MKVPPINETFLSNAVLQCLRTWKERAGETPLTLSWEDIDQLYDWVDNLQKRANALRVNLAELEKAEAPYRRTNQ